MLLRAQDIAYTQEEIRLCGMVAPHSCQKPVSLSVQQECN